MGYRLTIGEAELEYFADDLYLRISAKGATHPEAPNHCPYTGQGNSRSPSYTGWSEFCRDADIYPLFYGAGWSREERRYMECPEGFHRETPLLAEHPGAQPLCKGDLEYVRSARKRREETNGGKPAGFWDSPPGRPFDEIDNGNDTTLARLLWLEFWIEWALANCTVPILENT